MRTNPPNLRQTLFSVRSIVLCWSVALAGLAGAAEGLPPAPSRFFNDYAGVVSAPTAQRLEQTLEDFEKKTSTAILVAIFPRLPPNAALEDYAVRVFEAWKPGQKARDNGAILFVFPENRLMRIEVGYGLEGALPDALAKRIIDEQIKPRFQRGDFDGGVTAGVNGILQAVRGEYKATGGRARGNSVLRFLPFLLLVMFLIFAASRRRHGTVFHRRGRIPWGGWYGGGWGGSWGSGGGSSWRSGGGGGGFSGGGGRSGGGGASGSW